MGLLSGISTMRKIGKLKAGGKEKLSIADITNCIINLREGKRNLPGHQFNAVYAVYKTLQKCRTALEMDLDGYYEQAAIIIGIFNQVAPYEKYSGMETTEALFFADGVKPLLNELKPRSEALLNSMRAANPELNKYFPEEGIDIEGYLTELAKENLTKDNDYTSYIMENCPFLKQEYAIMFEGILVANLMYGKEKALELADQLFKKWIYAEAETGVLKSKEEMIYDPKMQIPWFCGALYPNGIVTKEESDKLSEKYGNLLVQQLLSLQTAQRQQG